MILVDMYCRDPMTWFPNNSRFHGYHHLNEGIKTNFSQPFFTFWDTKFGTDAEIE